MEPADYFYEVRDQAAADWATLHARESLAGPWRALFKQVLNHRHVISELLQNAEDADAREADVRVSEGEFVFTHDGRDFSPDDFSALCRFGVSNKRKVLTIGFWGIGFKSLFSLGPLVRLQTPTLSCEFRREAFTLPEWSPPTSAESRVVIRVPLDQKHREMIGTEIAAWAASPTPLLFFSSIHGVRFGDVEARKEDLGRGPVPDSRRWRLTGTTPQEVVVFRSKLEEWPADALDDVRRERGEADLSLPPVAVQAVLPVAGGTSHQSIDTGAGRLFCFLPTDVLTSLPIAGQAPFLPTADRKSIRAPAESAANTWLLGRLGRLVADSLVKWVEAPGETFRAVDAYALLPDPKWTSQNSLHAECACTMAEAFEAALGDRPFVLAAGGAAHPRNTVAALARHLLWTWPAEVLLNRFASSSSAVLDEGVSAAARRRLIDSGYVAEVSPSRVADVLAESRLPKPTPVQRLAFLWSFLEANSRAVGDWPTRLAVVPAEGRAELNRAGEISNKPAAVSAADWTFLARYVSILDTGWEPLTDSSFAGSVVKLRAWVSQALESEVPDGLTEPLQLAVMRAGLRNATGLEDLFARAGKAACANGPSLDAVVVFQAARRCDAPLRKADDLGFLYLCRDGKWRPASQNLLSHPEPTAEALLPPDWIREHTLDSAYWSVDCPFDENARDWLRLKTALSTFSMPQQTDSKMSLEALAKLARSRGAAQDPTAVLQQSACEVQDWDWPDAWCDRWSESGCWGDVALAVSGSWSGSWKDTTRLVAQQQGRKYPHRVDTGSAASAWVERLRATKVLPDEYGNLHAPAELYRRTAATEPLLNLEPFIASFLDTEKLKDLLGILGVRDEPASAGALVDRLASLSGVRQPPIGHVRDLLRAAERIAGRVNRDEQEVIRAAFRDRRLILGDDGSWRTSVSVYRRNPAQIPGVATVHPDLRDVPGLWDRLQVKEEPDLASALSWLESLSRYESLDDADVRSAVSLMAAYPDEVWSRAGCWLAGDGCLVPTARLVRYAQGREVLRALDAAFLSDVADLSMLHEGTAHGFAAARSLEPLEHLLERRASWSGPITALEDEWLQELGNVLASLHGRASQDDAPFGLDRQTGAALAEVQLLQVTDLRVELWFRGVAAGSSMPRRVAWTVDAIYLQGRPAALHEELVTEIAGRFVTVEARQAVRACAGRAADWIVEYALSHLALGPAAPSPPPSAQQPPGFDSRPPGPSLPPEAVPRQLPVLVQRIARKLRRFANFLGPEFRFDPSENAFLDGHGARVARCERPYHWRRTDPGPKVISYWLADSRIDSRIGIELPAEIWLLRSQGEVSILQPHGESFGELTLEELRRAADSGAVSVATAVYRVSMRRAAG